MNRNRDNELILIIRLALLKEIIRLHDHNRNLSSGHTPHQDTMDHTDASYSHLDRIGSDHQNNSCPVCQHFVSLP